VILRAIGNDEINHAVAVEMAQCCASGYGEDKTCLGSMDVTTGSKGNVSDQITLGALTPGAFITGTAH